MIKKWFVSLAERAQASEPQLKKKSASKKKQKTGQKTDCNLTTANIKM